MTYLTHPAVFRKTDAAYAWVTPTRLLPSTSMIWSLTCILPDRRTDRQTDTNRRTYTNRRTDRQIQTDGHTQTDGQTDIQPDDDNCLCIDTDIEKDQHNHVDSAIPTAMHTRQTSPHTTDSYLLTSSGWSLIKYPNTKIAISQKCLNIFAPNFAHLFVTIPCTNVFLCAVFTWHHNTVH